MRKVKRKKAAIVAAVAVVVLVVMAATISLETFDPKITVVNNSKSVTFTWKLQSNSTANITGNVVSYFQVLKDNSTRSTVAFSAEFVPLPNPSANNELFFEFYTNITGNLSSVLHPDYITFMMNDYGNNTNFIKGGEVQTSFSIPTKADNVSPINNGLDNSFGHIGSLSYSAKLLNVLSSGHSTYHFRFKGMTLITLSYSSLVNKTTGNTFNLYAQLKGLSKPVTCGITFMITTVA